MSVAPLPPVSLQNLRGAWQRRNIRWPDGRSDLTTRVLWLQGEADYADIRIPANRPSFEGCRSFADCAPHQLRWLASQQGFAGLLLERADGTFNWRRDIDFQPPGGKPDVGRLRYTHSDQQVMIEDGVLEPYVEVWERPSPDDAPDQPAAIRLTPRPDRRGLIVAGGGYFLLAIDRRPPLDPAASLSVLLDALPARADPARLLDMELSVGKRHPDPARWIVTASTLPWREGERALEPETLGEKEVIRALLLNA